MKALTLSGMAVLLMAGIAMGEDDSELAQNLEPQHVFPETGWFHRTKRDLDMAKLLLLAKSKKSSESSESCCSNGDEEVHNRMTNMINMLLAKVMNCKSNSHNNYGWGGIWAGYPYGCYGWPYTTTTDYVTTPTPPTEETTTTSPSTVPISEDPTTTTELSTFPTGETNPNW